MLQPTVITWMLVLFGIVFLFLLMLYAQLLMVVRPHGRKTRDLLIGEGDDWRDKTHLRMSLGIAWADLILWLPLLCAGSIGVLMGQTWGYALWAAAGAIAVYINIIFWSSEREYVYPSRGPLAYYTYYWGFFVYWGVAVITYTILRLAGLIF